MIGSFWNLCRACPSMPVDKQLHSEYRSTYRWHEFTGNSRPEVVRRAPAPNPSQFIGPTNEPPLPRRKKCPELAYKSHEFIIGSEYTDARNNIGANRLARSEERGGTPSRRSKSEGPPVVPNGRAFPIPTGRDADGAANKQAGESSGLFKKTISKLSTEYRLQFVWPNVRRIKGNEANDAVDQPKKSISMGALKSSQQQQQQLHLRQHQQHHQTMAAMPTVHKKRTTNQKEATLHELEPLVSDAEERKPNEKQVTIVEKVERKMTIRPFSQTFDQERVNHFITKKENFGFENVADNKQQQVEPLLNGTAPPRSQPNLDLWFKEVVELRKKAGEYKCRGWGIEIDPDLYKKQKDLWDQVSKRSSLSALSLASSVHRPITKEEKEQENNKKSTPLSKTQKSRVPGQAYLIDNKDEISALPARFNNIRHHLERTTGPDVEEGALLPSPTREKLMPAITKRESESQRGSPKKTAASRHGSPQKGSPQKGSPKKVIKMRSQSVGPTVVENVSPKRQLRSASTAPTAKAASAPGKRTTTVGATGVAATVPGSTTTAAERKTRPSTLSTTFHSRSKSSSLPHSARAHSVPATTTTTTTSSTTTKATTNQQHAHQSQSSHSTDNKQHKKLPPAPAHHPQLRKKDKDKSNIRSVSGGTSRVPPRPRPQSTSALMTKSIMHPSPSAVIQPNAAATHSAPTAAVIAPTQATVVIAPVAPPISSGVAVVDKHQQISQPVAVDSGVSKTVEGPKAAVAGVGGIGAGVVGVGFGGDGGGDGVARVVGEAATKRLALTGLTVSYRDNKLVETDGDDARDAAISVASCSPQPAPLVPDEPIVKSPPEPTRVKSPEQILMRSPDPVNWTVPLDTGKTFTVTQNVKEGENYSRPQSEIKASTPVEKPPPPPQSAPPQLTEQAKMDAWKNADYHSEHKKLSSPSPSGNTSPTATMVVATQPTAGAGGLPAARYATKPVPGSTLRCLDDPLFDLDTQAGASVAGGNTSSSSTSTTTTNTAPTARNTAADVLEKARDRFDRFWGGNGKEDQV